MLNTYKIDQSPASLLWEGAVDQDFLSIAKSEISKLERVRKTAGVNPSLSKQSLETLPEHKWLQKCETILVNHSEMSLDDLLDKLRSEADFIEPRTVALKDDENYKVVSLDLETIGLNQAVKFIGGKKITYNAIVGVCIAASTTKGYYIPVLHNENDDVKNFPREQVIDFLQKVVDEFYMIFHNAVFDQEILSMEGVMLNNVRFSDTMLLAGHKGLKIKYNQVGLKFLSDKLLGRKMVEIKEVSGADDVALQNQPATNVYVYGCSDAMNTLALFYELLSGGDSENPYLFQKNATVLDHKMVKHIRSMYRIGLPMDYNDGIKVLKTMIRRRLIIEEFFYSLVPQNIEIEISSPEKLGMYLVSVFRESFEKEYNEGRELGTESKGFKAFCAKLKGDFEMEVKIKTSKAGSKIVANTGDDQLVAIIRDINTKWDFVDQDLRDKLVLICEAVGLYRSLAHEVNVLKRLCRFAFNDDLNICRSGIALKLNGADTTRFSNASSKGGSFDNLIIQRATRGGYNITRNVGNGVCGVNSQGISSSPGKWRKLRKIDVKNKFPQEVKDRLKKMDTFVDVELKELMVSTKL